jgi:SAM-dependent methyltransferase
MPPAGTPALKDREYGRSYPDLPNPDLLSRIPLTARLVVDVGCGTGALGAAFKRRNPTVRYIGIERDAAAAAVARERLDLVLEADAELAELPLRPGEAVDCLIYGDVLEHFVDPWATLRRHTELLAEDGLVLACVPNVENWQVIDALLRGSWRYEAAGLFDQTHLRWFSLETMRQALENAGLAPFDVAPRVFAADAAEEFATRLGPALEAFGVERAAFLRRAAPLQYVFRATRRHVSRLFLDAKMLPHIGGVSQVRIVDPLFALATVPGVTARLSLGHEPPIVDFSGPKVALLHRQVLASEASIAKIAELLRAGYLLVADFDDHPDAFPLIAQTGHRAFRAVHAVQTSTEALATVLRALNPEVAVFPNALPELPEPKNFADPACLKLFFGAFNRETDWAPIMPALNAVLQVARGRVHIEVVHDRKFFEVLDTADKGFTPTCDHATYLGILGGCDLALMPLEDTTFNRAKSDLKFVEASGCRVAALASDVVYGESIADDFNGLLFRDPSGFQRQLLRAIADPEATRRIADTARGIVGARRMLAGQLAARRAWYQSLWDQRETLTEALLARTPEISLGHDRMRVISEMQ